MQQLLITVLLLLISAQLIAQKTVLSGKEADYKGKEITFYSIAEPILHQKFEMATTKVAEDGTFSVALPLNQTVEIYTDLEKYCGTMVVEPGKDYRITLPPFSLRTSAEAHSAYFKPAPFWLGLPETGNNDLNFTVRSFISDFNLETAKNAIPIYQQRSKEIVNKIIESLDKKYSKNQNQYFLILKRYYFAELEYAVNQRSPESIILKYFANKPLQLAHPVYQRVFDLIFTDFLRNQSQNIQNQKIISLTNSGRYLDLVAFFEHKGYRKEFAELAVLKGLNDGYYTGSFSKEGVIKAIELAQTATTCPRLITVALQIKNKITMLAVGRTAPAIKLNNTKKETITLEQYNGKFVYLSFIHSRSSDCRTELDSVVSIEKNLRQVLSVVSIALDDDFDNAAKLWKTKEYPWELLNGSKQKQLVINYNSSIAPVFYLIAPDGTLLLSPAPSPSRGFEPLFLKLIRDYHFKHKLP